MTTKTKSRSARVVVSASRAAKPKARSAASAVSAARLTATRAKARPANPIAERESLTELLQIPPNNMEDYLLRIRGLGERITDCIKFMCGVEQMNGTCAEA